MHPPSPSKPAKLAAAPRPKIGSKPPAAQPAPMPQPAQVRPLMVQMIAKQMQKLMAQQQFLTSPDEAQALTPGTAEAKIAARQR